MIRFIAFILLLSTASANAWSTPERGTALRKDLMNAARGPAEKVYGAPVEFVVFDLRVSGSVAFASLGTQRPGGRTIDVKRTPGWANGYFLPDADNLSGQALLRKRGGTWRAEHITFGATDVWWSDPSFCKVYKAVIPEFC